MLILILLYVCFFYLYYMFCNNHCIKYFINKKNINKKNTLPCRLSFESSQAEHATSPLRRLPNAMLMLSVTGLHLEWHQFKFIDASLNRCEISIM